MHTLRRTRPAEAASRGWRAAHRDDDGVQALRDKLCLRHGRLRAGAAAVQLAHRRPARVRLEQPVHGGRDAEQRGVAAVHAHHRGQVAAAEAQV